MQLISLSMVKQVLGIVTTEQDELLTFYIDAVSSQIKKYCETDFELKNREEKILNIRGQKGFLLYHFPVASITSIEGIARDSFSWSSEGYISLRYPLGIDSVRVVYSAGYATIPKDVSLACLKMVVDQYKKRNERGGISSERIGSYSYSLEDVDGFSQEIKSLLDPYRRKV